MATEANPNAHSQTIEKDFPHDHPNGARGAHYSGDAYLLNDPNMDSDTALSRIRTAGSIAISPELFEKLYLSPQNAVKGDLRKTFGNPTPLALLGFLMSLHPLSCDLMGWRGAGGAGAASTGVFLYFGGLLMIIGAFLEFILGNTFPFIVFSSFGAFWLTFATTLIPFYNVYGAYAPAGQDAAAGLSTTGFNASFAFVLVFMCLMCAFFLVLSLRTNVVFVIIFTLVVPAFGILAGAYFQLAQGNVALAGNLLIVGGAFLFACCIPGWWIWFAIMLAVMDFPFQLPVGDLSTMIKGASVRAKEKESMA